MPDETAEDERRGPHRAKPDPAPHKSARTCPIEEPAGSPREQHFRGIYDRRERADKWNRVVAVGVDVNADQKKRDEGASDRLRREITGEGDTPQPRPSHLSRPDVQRPARPERL